MVIVLILFIWFAFATIGGVLLGKFISRGNKDYD
jgi:Na+-transporting methylmalonyl-CoA/oxaloacetate decarboxylase beta subunit